MLVVIRYYYLAAQATTGKQGVLGPTKIYLAVQPGSGGQEAAATPVSTQPPPLAPVQQAPAVQQPSPAPQIKAAVQPAAPPQVWRPCFPKVIVEHYPTYPNDLDLACFKEWCF